MPWGYEGSAQSPEEIKKKADALAAGNSNSPALRTWTPEGNTFLKQGLDTFSRPHIQGDMSASDAILNGGVAEGRANQVAAHDFFSNAAKGYGPNIAQQNLNLGLDRVGQQQATVSPGLAALAAQQAGANMGSGLAAQAGQARQQEQLNSMQGMGQSTNALQSAELGLLNQGLGRAQGQMNLDLGSMQQNAGMATSKIGLADFYNQIAQKKFADEAGFGTGLQNSYDNLLTAYGPNAEAKKDVGRGFDLFGTFAGGAAGGLGK